MKKTLILATAAIAAMASCTKETFVGDMPAGSAESPIVFGNANSAVTKAAPAPTPKDHAEKLGGSFVVYGWKNVDGANSVVFDHYNIKFVDGTALSTPSNLRGWEYVGITPVNGTGETEVASTTGWTAVAGQTIKYWDNNADYYKFIAFSKGKGFNGNYASFSIVDTTKIGTDSPVYTASGSSDVLASVYIADLDSVGGTDNYKKSEPVTPKFKSVGAKIRVAFYETIPGYSVKSLTFLNAAGKPSADNKVLLYTANGGHLPVGTGELKVFIDKEGKATAEFALTAVTPVDSLLFNGPIILKAAKEGSEPVGNYMGRASSEASYSNAVSDSAYKSVLPSNGVDLGINVKYTLVSTDGRGEEIEVGPVSVIIPKTYTKWQSNYAYTYIFKITDSELEPITFDAFVTDTQEGVQETVTALQTGPLTTYAKGVNPTTDSEYKKNSNIYIGHKDPKDNFDGGGKLYTVNVESGACQDITEGSFANAMALINNGYHDIVKASESDAQQVGPLTTGADVSEYYTKDGNEYIHCVTGAVAVDGKNYYSIENAKITAWIIKDANGKKMTIAKANCALTIVTAIPAADAPDGKTAISGHFGMFTPSTAGIYAFAYADGTTYKIINVVE